MIDLCILTDDPSVRLHFIPIVDHVDAQSESNELRRRAEKSQLHHQFCMCISLLLDFSILSLLFFEFLFELSNDILGA